MARQHYNLKIVISGQRGSGKTTIATLLTQFLREQGLETTVEDEDYVETMSPISLIEAAELNKKRLIDLNESNRNKILVITKHVIKGIETEI